jgi:hypothetical protein
MKDLHRASPDAMAQVKRYAELVDKGFSQGLTPAEDAERRRLGEAIDAESDSYFEPILKELCTETKKLNDRDETQP